MSDISAPESTERSRLREIIMENKVTMPTPPAHAVDIRQNCNPRGSPSMSLTMEAPVVVNPDTLSNRAFMGVKSRPYIR